MYFCSLLLKLLLDKSDIIASTTFLSTTPCTDIVDSYPVIPSSLQYFLMKLSTEGKKSFMYNDTIFIDKLFISFYISFWFYWYDFSLVTTLSVVKLWWNCYDTFKWYTNPSISLSNYPHNLPTKPKNPFLSVSARISIICGFEKYTTIREKLTIKSATLSINTFDPTAFYIFLKFCVVWFVSDFMWKSKSSSNLGQSVMLTWSK